ncbi:probable 28S ribosomal protein S10, mitochondrial [Callorhinchus milii]|uniref:Small ribosomal subunit protein uS10m n=1 Tax=Callorhinchus milii TaxID=7868 RepID=K4GBI7_CALMI|nr:small ribosomal subunit protein uS10m [Callorhinchus milii]AFM89976.1 28S ribosomal protein S10, mitochondrial [Callorhinchus milii]
MVKMAAVHRGLVRLLPQCAQMLPVNCPSNSLTTEGLCIGGPLVTLSSRIHLGSTNFDTTSLVTLTDEPDRLYKNISVLVKGHDKAVLDSYEYFAALAAKMLNISVDEVYEPQKKMERMTLLKSVHIFKKHRVQYEMRTHYRCIELKHLTGSTADVYLEYIQRNLPEGVAMEVTKTMLQQLPEYINEPVWNSNPSEDATKTDR